MHVLLSRLLEKRGIKNSDELTSEEKSQFQKWEYTLAGGEMTIERLELFCKEQLSRIEKQFKEVNLPTEHVQRLTLQHAVYSTLIEALTAPQKDREQLESYLQGLLQSS
jgi:hypothetical protein